MSIDINNLNKMFGVSSNDGTDPKKVKKPKDIENLDKMFGIDDSASKSTDSKYTTAFKDSKKDINIDLTNRDYISEYDDPFNTDGGTTDLNELRANRQGNGVKALSGLGRVGAKIVAEVAKMPGYIAGAVAAPFAEENEGWETMVNNSWVKSIGELNESFNTEVLPVYVKKAVSEGNLWDNISSIDFWATEGADGIGYIASMMVPGAALKGLGVGAQLSKLRLLRGVVSAQKADVITATIANTLFEAGAEAGGAMENFQKEMDRKLTSGEITDEEYADMKVQKSRLGRDIFLSNSIILLGPNALQANMLWGKGLTKSMSKVADGGEGALNKMVVQPTIYQKVLNRGKDVLTAGASEGLWEEGMQMTVENMFTNSAKKGELGNNLFKDFNLSELGEAYIDTITSTEGQKAMFLGAFLGGGMQAYQGAKTDIQSRKTTQSLLDTGNTAIDAFYKTMTVDMYNEDGKPNPEKLKEKLEAFGQIEQLNLMYNVAVEKQDKEALEKLRDLAATQLAYGFIMNEELGLDVLKEHLESSSQFEEIVQREQDAGNKTTKKDIIDNVMSKAKVLESAYTNFNDFAPSLISPNLTGTQTKDDVVSFTNTLRGKYLSNKANINLLNESLAKLNKQRESVLKDLEEDEMASEMNQGINSFDERLISIGNDINETTTNLERLKKLDKNFWNKEHLQKAFDRYSKNNKELEEKTTPEKALTIDETKDAISNAQSLEELDAIDLMNDPFLTRSFNAKKAELEEIVRTEREVEITTENENAENENIDNAVNSETAKEFTKTNKVGDIVEDPFTGQESVIESISKNSIGLRDTVTNQTSIYEFEEDLRDDISADEVIVTDSNPIKPGATHSDHKTVGIEYENSVQFTNYIMEPRDKTGDIITFQLNKGSQTVPIKPEGQKAIDLIDSKDPNRLEILKQNRQLLIDTLPITFVYNGGPATSWSSFKSPNAKKLRENIVNALIQGANLSDLSTKVTNQENASFNTKFENGKPVKNNPLDLEFVKSLNETNPENNVTLYHVSKEGKLILVSDNKSPLLLKSANDLSSQKGQIFIGLINPKGNVVPAKLNFSKLNNAKASTLAQIYGELLKDMSLAEKSINQLKVLNPTLFEEVQQTLSNEIELLGNKTSDITLAGLIELLVYESSSNDKSITYEQDENGNNFIEYDNQIYNENNLDKLGEALSSKYHNVITITKEDSINPTINFKNPAYIKYLFSQGIVTTNLNVEGSAFLQSTDIKLPIEKGRGSELWIDSNVDSKLQVQPKSTNTVTLQELIKDKVKELNDRINAILDTIPEGSDTATAPEFMMTEQGQFITEIGGVEIGKARFDFEKMTTDGGPVTYKQLREEVVDIITKNYDDIVKNITPKVTTTSQTSSTQSEIEATKTDIERRRQRSLSKIIPQTKTVLSTGEERITSYRSAYFPKEYIDENDWQMMEVIERKNKQDLIKEINTKYDVELKELESENNLENNNIELLNPEDIRRPNGSIGTQGFDPSQMKDLVKYMSELLNLNIPENLLDKNIDELKPLIDYIKNNEDIKNKIIEYVKSNPSIITRLPDDTIHFEDGNHRANLLNIIGSDVIPVIDKNNQENIRNSEKNSVSLPKNNVTMSNEFNIPGTEANKEYEKAVKELEGEDLVDYNKIVTIIEKAKLSKDNMISRGNTAAAEKFENTIKRNEELLRTKVETIIKNKKC